MPQLNSEFPNRGILIGPAGSGVMLLPATRMDMTSLSSRAVARAEPRNAILELPPPKEIPLRPQQPHTQGR